MRSQCIQKQRMPAGPFDSMASLLVHHSPAAGSWYPADKSELDTLLSDVFQRSSERTGPFVRPGGVGFIVPHAAPAYSGAVAASVYRHVGRTDASRIIILGFSHSRPIQGIGIPDISHYSTPLGLTRVDLSGAESLLRNPLFRMVPEHVVCDHSVEIQIPFVQKLLPEAVVLPLFVGHLTDDDRHTAADNLRQVLDPATILIASSDLTHYGPDFGYVPFRVDDRACHRLRDLDEDVLSAAGSLDASVFLEELDRTGATVCGAGPISLLLDVLRGAAGEEVFQETLDYESSGDITHDYGRSVSYGGIGYFSANRYRISPCEERLILAHAREALTTYLQTGELSSPSDAGGLPVVQGGGVFVTLYAQGALRGCVGCFEKPGPVARIVPELTVAAACQDPRFRPVRANEQIDIELHILTPKKRIRDASQIALGEHGVYFRFRNHCALLLPGVAIKHGLDRTELLKWLARKAGMRRSVFSREQARLYIFREQVITDWADAGPAVPLPDLT